MATPTHKSNTFESLKNDILKLIQNKIFLGRYTEKRYVESLAAYRDVIIIESSEDIVKNLLKTKKLLEAFASDKWIGISNDPQNSESDVCLLWVKLNHIPVGKHWFQMSAINFEANEIILEIQHVQQFRAPDKSFNTTDQDFPSFDPKEIFTYKNMCEAIKFSAIVIMTLLTFTVEALRYLADFSIQISYVIVSFVHASTPICLGIFEFLTKCVAGFYWLIYVMFRGNPNTPAVPAALMGNQRAIGYNAPYRQTNYQNFKQSSWQNRYKYEKQL